MISLQRSMHSSQMYTPGPAMSFLTCFCDLPQNEHFSRSPPPSPILAMRRPPAFESLFGPLRRGRRGCVDRGRLTNGDDVVDDAVLLGLRRGQDEVAIGVLADALHRLTGVVGEDLLEQHAHALDLLGRELDVDRLAHRLPVGL